MRFSLLYLFAAAVLIRGISLTQSFWLDEAITANVVRTLDGAAIVSQFSPTDFHPPGYYLFLKLWSVLFGVSEVSLRTPSIIFSIIAGWFVYQITLLYSSRNTAWWASAFFLFNPLILYYSQEARMYLMVTMLFAGLLYCALILEKHGLKLTTRTRLGVIAGGLLGGILACLTFYGSFIGLAGAILGFTIFRRWRAVILLSTALVLGAGIAAPLLITQLQNSALALAAVQNWSLVLGTPTLKNLALVPLKFVTGRLSFDPKLVYYAVGGFSTLLVWGAAIRAGWNHRLLALFVVLPLCIGSVISFVTPMMQYFRFIYLLVPLAVLLALGVQQLWQRSVLLGIFLSFSLLYLLGSPFHREDWKHVLMSVPGSKPIYMVPSSSDPILYYYPDREIRDIRDISTFDVSTADRTQSGTAETEIFIIPYTAEIHGISYVPVLEQQGFARVDQTNFNGVVLEYWKR
jgi:uncharacterized membrane protein